MNQDPPNAPAPEARVCPTGQSRIDVFADNLENTASGNWVKQTAVGVNGWYYPQPASADLRDERDQEPVRIRPARRPRTTRSRCRRPCRSRRAPTAVQPRVRLRRRHVRHLRRRRRRVQRQRRGVDRRGLACSPTTATTAPSPRSTRTHSARAVRIRRGEQRLLLEPSRPRARWPARTSASGSGSGPTRRSTTTAGSSTTSRSTAAPTRRSRRRRRRRPVLVRNSQLGTNTAGDSVPVRRLVAGRRRQPDPDREPQVPAQRQRQRRRAHGRDRLGRHQEHRDLPDAGQELPVQRHGEGRGRQRQHARRAGRRFRTSSTRRTAARSSTAPAGTRGSPRAAAYGGFREADDDRGRDRDDELLRAQRRCRDARCARPRAAPSSA